MTKLTMDEFLLEIKEGDCNLISVEMLPSELFSLPDVLHLRRPAYFPIDSCVDFVACDCSTNIMRHLNKIIPKSEVFKYLVEKRLSGHVATREQIIEYFENVEKIIK